MESTNIDKQNNAIDLAKFICAILVVMIHISPFGFYVKPNLIAYFNYVIQQYLARLAVPFFFIASGYFLYRKTSLKNFSIEPTKKYAKKLLGHYIIWSVIYFPLNYIKFTNDERGMFHAVLLYIRDFIFVGSYRHLWYLNATIFAVVLISVLLYKNVSPKKMLAAAYMLYFVGLFDRSWYGFIVPLKEAAPHIWNVLKFIQMIIVTTRNGLFEGFLFVGIGMLFAFYEINIPKKKAFMGFAVSMVLMFFEVFILQYFKIIRGYEAYFFLVPAAFFMFSIVRDIRLPDNKIYKTLRILSSLIFYMHLWVEKIVGNILTTINDGLTDTFLCFVLTLLVTIIFAIIVMKLSNISRFKWLKKFYV